MNIITHDNLYRLVYVTLLTVTVLLLSSTNFKFQTIYSEENWPYFNTISDSSTNIDKTYENAVSGFKIVLPKDWNHIDNENIVLISPNKINQNTGGIKFKDDNVMMIIQIVPISDFHMNMKEYKEGYERNGCKILSDKFIEINNLSSQEIFKQCKSQNKEEKVLNYILATRKTIIFIGIKGEDLGFDRNLDEFINSVKTITIKNPIDIRQLALFNSIP